MSQLAGIRGLWSALSSRKESGSSYLYYHLCNRCQGQPAGCTQYTSHPKESKIMKQKEYIIVAFPFLSLGNWGGGGGSANQILKMQLGLGLGIGTSR